MKGYVTIHYLDGTAEEVYVNSLDETYEEVYNVSDDATNEDILLQIFPELRFTKMPWKDGKYVICSDEWLNKKYFDRPKKKFGKAVL